MPPARHRRPAASSEPAPGPTTLREIGPERDCLLQVRFRLLDLVRVGVDFGSQIKRVSRIRRIAEAQNRLIEVAGGRFGLAPLHEQQSETGMRLGKPRIERDRPFESAARAFPIARIQKGVAEAVVRLCRPRHQAGRLPQLRDGFRRSAIFGEDAAQKQVGLAIPRVRLNDLAGNRGPPVAVSLCQKVPGRFQGRLLCQPILPIRIESAAVSFPLPEPWWRVMPDPSVTWIN